MHLALAAFLLQDLFLFHESVPIHVQGQQVQMFQTSLAHSLVLQSLLEQAQSNPLVCFLFLFLPYYNSFFTFVNISFNFVLRSKSSSTGSASSPQITGSPESIKP